MTLHREAVPHRLWVLLVGMMKIVDLRDFRLVGGTALALQLGHRQSIDVDLFTDKPFDAESLAERIPMQRQRIRENSVTGEIDGIKVDLIAHRYAWIDEPVESENIRLASMRDLAAMKLNAVANRGSKKDFWDIAALLDRMTVAEMIDCYRLRYPHMDDWQALRSLAFFDDAEPDPDPLSRTDVTWGDVKQRIKDACRFR